MSRIGAVLHRRVDAVWKQRARLCATGGTASRADFDGQRLAIQMLHAVANRNSRCFQLIRRLQRFVQRHASADYRHFVFRALAQHFETRNREFLIVRIQNGHFRPRSAQVVDTRALGHRLRQALG
jgi:hypothetical protein